jgi:hypothetical protein
MRTRTNILAQTLQRRRTFWYDWQKLKDLFVFCGLANTSVNGYGKYVATRTTAPATIFYPPHAFSVLSGDPHLLKNGPTISVAAPKPDRKWLTPAVVVPALITVSLAIAGGFATLVRVLWTMNTSLTELRIDVSDVKDGQKKERDTMSRGFGDVKALIHELHPGDRDTQIILKHLLNQAVAGTSSSFWHLPIRVKDANELAIEPSHLPGALAINVVNAHPGQLVDVLASRAGTVSKVESALDDVHYNRPNDGRREFVTVEIRHDDNTVLMYSRLTMDSEHIVKEGMVVGEGQKIGEAQAFSPVCLRVCLKLSESDSCQDPRSLFPKMPLVTRKLEQRLDKREP